MPEIRGNLAPPGPDTFASVIERSADCVAILSLEGRVRFVNPAGCQLIGAQPDELRGLDFVDLLPPADVTFVREVVLPTVGADGRWSGDLRFSLAPGTPVVPVFCTLFFVGDRASERSGIALVAHDIRARRRAERRLRALVDAGATLTNSLQSDQTLRNACELIVERLATFCIIHLFERDAHGALTVTDTVAHHIDRAMQETLDELARYAIPHDVETHPLVQIVRDGSSSLVAHVDDAWIARVSSSPAQANLYRTLGIRSFLAVPLVANGAIVGSLVCGMGTEERERPRAPFYDAEDLFFTEEIGRRAGIAIDNAQRYEREHRIAIALQEASLPRSLPHSRSLRFDAEYRPGSSEATVGGDWYDAFALDDGRFAFTVGDVLGKGLAAAVLMSKLRQAMQTAAYLTADPNTMLDAADAMLRRHDADVYATALAAIYDPATGCMTFACAGHPGPLVRTPAGEVTQLQRDGLLLGLRSGGDLDIGSVELPNGSSLVLFTDGLVESTHDIDAGYRRLVAALERTDPRIEPRPAGAILRAVLDDHDARDDVALLVVTVDQR